MAYANWIDLDHDNALFFVRVIEALDAAYLGWHDKSQSNPNQYGR